MLRSTEHWGHPRHHGGKWPVWKSSGSDQRALSRSQERQIILLRLEPQGGSTIHDQRQQRLARTGEITGFDVPCQNRRIGWGFHAGCAEARPGSGESRVGPAHGGDGYVVLASAGMLG